MKLNLTATETEHSLDVVLAPWDEDLDCIVLVLDGRNDMRSPTLLACEARRLAMNLTLAAEALEARTERR